MTAYTKTSDFAIKDSLLSGNPSKVVRGTEIDTEFNAIQAADADNVKVSGLATGVVTFLGTPTSANLAAVLTDETGSGAAVFANSPVLVTPALGTPSSATLANATGLPAAGVVGTALVTAAIGTTVQAYDADLTTWAGVTPGTGVATALAVNVGSAGAPVVNGGALGTPSSGTVTNLTGTASININGTVGATTPAAGTFTTLTSTGNATLGDAEATDTHAIKGATTLLANSASAALTVTQTGAGNAFVVEDSTSPDSTPFVIDAGGNVGVGVVTGLFGTSISVVGTGVAGAISAANYGSDNVSFAYKTYKTRNASIYGHTVVQSGDGLGAFQFFGSDGSAYLQSASITAAVDGIPGTNDMPGRLMFSTTADGASIPTERMRIDSVGNVGIGGTATAGRTVEVSKNVTGATTAYGLLANGAIQSDVTVANLVDSIASQTAGTISNLRCFFAEQGTLSGTATNLFGFGTGTSLTGATNNYGFYSNIAAAANRYNFYAAGTADNYFAGATGIGIAPAATSNLTVAASTAAVSSLNIPHGSAPSSPVNGDMWSTTTGLFIRINGVTKTVTLT